MPGRRRAYGKNPLVSSSPCPRNRAQGTRIRITRETVPEKGGARECSVTLPSSEPGAVPSDGPLFFCLSHSRLQAPSPAHLTKRISPRKNNKCEQGGQQASPAVCLTRESRAGVAQRQRVSLPRMRCGFDPRLPLQSCGSSSAGQSTCMPRRKPRVRIPPATPHSTLAGVLQLVDRPRSDRGGLGHWEFDSPLRHKCRSGAMVDAAGREPVGPEGPCEFESRLRHQTTRCGVAQWRERVAHNHQGEGSSPSPATQPMRP